MKSAEQYKRVFDEERTRCYAEVEQIEIDAGYKVDRTRLETAARVLACPVKVNPPNWQHGRVIYALVRGLLEDDPLRPGLLLDIGTAKGFSACVMTWAAQDAGARRRVISVDVIDPLARVARNSVLEADGSLHTVPEFVAPYQAQPIEFHGGGSLALLDTLVAAGERVRFAFVDGKHDYKHVHAEAAMLRKMQSTGDVVLFDDMQIPLVAEAVRAIPGYLLSHVSVCAKRAYAIGVRQ